MRIFKSFWNEYRNVIYRNTILMTDPGKQKNKDKEQQESFPDKEKGWDNPKNPEATEDARDNEQLERQIEEAKRRKENLTEED